MKKIISVTFLLVFGFLFFGISTVHAATLYYNAAVDTDWNTLGNWWQDAGHGTPALALPTSGDDVIISGDIYTNTGLAASVNTFETNNSTTLIPVTVANGATFDASLIYNTITGNAVFNNGSALESGTITGNAVFNDTCFNNGGTIGGNAILNTDSYNTGTISGNATFNNASFSDVGSTISGNAIFNDTSYNGGDITGNAVFNYATGGTIILSNSQYWGAVYGSSTGGDSVLLTEYVFNDSSSNAGIVKGNAVFNADSFNGGEVTGNATFNDRSFNYDGVVDGNAIFNTTSYNGGDVTGNATFNDSSYNNTCFRPCFHLGTVRADATFNNSSYNGGGVVGNATFNSESYNQGEVNGNAVFSNISYNDGGVIDTNATFNDSSYNNGVVGGNAIFNTTSYNNGGISGNANFYDSTINQGSVNGDACFALTADRDGGTVGNDLGACVLSLPTVTTNPFSPDTFSGTIAETGGETISTVGFQYGDNGAYDTTINLSGTYNRDTFTNAVSNLSVCHNYHYRAFATNSAGTGYGEDVSFTVDGRCVRASGSMASGFTTPTTTPTTEPTITPIPPIQPTTPPTPPPADTTCHFTLTLMRGNTGEDVKCLQQGLNARLNTNLVIDGIFGPKTEQAVIKFQLAHNLKGDGIFGILSRVAWNK